MADTMNELCPCGSGKQLHDCCMPIIEGTALARTPEELMRARFTAHCQRNYQYLVDSTHPDHREGVSVDEINHWAQYVDWKALEVHSATPGETENTGAVSFTAHYEVREIPQELKEDSTFERIDGKWFYVDGVVQGQEPYERETPRIGRNDQCPCGSGKKFKKCCGK